MNTKLPCYSTIPVQMNTKLPCYYTIPLQMNAKLHCYHTIPVMMNTKVKTTLLMYTIVKHIVNQGCVAGKSSLPWTLAPHLNQPLATANFHGL